ncbi:inactive shikimate kinase like 1 chloroplastic isoform X1 [Tripterygium wilfordii]|uniref:Inactive shikimate kinase like 1 chloroplastic isoform X1 n=1 Tax=Tripterygium wilfordii TaxID=458696 RepID=A0A7J7BTX1_TRIWF|nr:probable inactive shikimate kinase like 1, chloroplastic [Tripterygium wilfordii]KAF5725429.1 inactive shikimate kinase like 1 chloroplastic isoform X1 [Tripterygium wilfordii]
MEMTTTLQFHSPIVASLSSQLSRSFPPCNYNQKQNPIPFHTRPIGSTVTSRKSLTAACSLLDGAPLSPNVDAVERSLAVKKKAMGVSSQLKGTSIFLLGINNSVKSSMGKLLADVLRYYYFDSDSLVIEAAGGESAAKSLRESDAKGFRESETEVLKQLSSMGRLVVCAGDGAVQSSTNLALIRHGISLWIDVPLDLVAREMIQDQDQHPTSDISISESESEVLTQLITQYEEMRSGYSTADATVSLQKVATLVGCDDLNAVTAEDVTMEVLKEIERLTRVKKMMEAAATPF